MSLTCLLYSPPDLVAISKGFNNFSLNRLIPALGSTVIVVVIPPLVIIGTSNNTLLPCIANLGLLLGLSLVPSAKLLPSSENPG